MNHYQIVSHQIHQTIADIAHCQKILTFMALGFTKAFTYNHKKLLQSSTHLVLTKIHKQIVPSESSHLTMQEQVSKCF